ncbi:MAG: glutathione S-transferase N-terminal domain-containing protein [Pseudomonadota bacterium]
MIDLYYAATPNGLKLTLCLEELGVPYRIIPVRLSKGEQFAPEFLAISPNNKIPAMVDHAPADDGPPLSMFESGAMLLYLADKYGQLMPTRQRARQEVLQWLFWQVGGLGPAGGQAGHFRAHAPEPVPYAIERYTREVGRLLGVLDRRLEQREFIAETFSIADIAAYPWVVPHQGLGQRLSDFPNLQRWFDAIARRPATERAYQGVEEAYSPHAPALSEEARRALFGQLPR